MSYRASAKAYDRKLVKSACDEFAASKPADAQSPVEITPEQKRAVASAIDTTLPPGHGFVFLSFPLNKEGGPLDYISNTRRDGAIAKMKDFIRQCESQPLPPT